MGDRGFLVWKGHGSDQGIYSARQRLGAEFEDAERVRYFAGSRGITAVVKPGDHGILTVWRGADDDSRIWFATAWFDGSAWSDQANPAGGPRTDDRPALGVLGDRVFMAWRGTGPDQHIWYSEFGPSGWTSSHGPALARIDNRFWMVWKGAGGDERLWWTRDDFRSQQAVRDGYTTSDTPAFVGIDFAGL